MALLFNNMYGSVCVSIVWYVTVCTLLDQVIIKWRRRQYVQYVWKICKTYRVYILKTGLRGKNVAL